MVFMSRGKVMWRKGGSIYTKGYYWVRENWGGDNDSNKIR
jgi:hypothetical protein